jgi:hypothetical protein
MFLLLLLLLLLMYLLLLLHAGPRTACQDHQSRYCHKCWVRRSLARMFAPVLNTSSSEVAHN